MKRYIALIGLMVILSSMFVAGCDEEQEVTPVQTAPQGNPKRVVMTDIRTPRYTEYEDGGYKVKREVKIWRFMSPFGKGAGEVIAAQNPMKFEYGGTPGMRINPDGINVDKSKQSKLDTGGFKGGIIDMIWTKIKNFAWFAMIVVGVGAGVFFLVPGAQPIIMGMLRAVMSIVPIVGSLIERIFAGIKWKKPLVETVKGGQNFKTALANNSDMNLSPSQKAQLKEMFNDSMSAKQDVASQKTVKEIKSDT